MTTRNKGESVQVEDKGEPVMIADTYRFYIDAQAAAEAVYDDGGDPATTMAHPCTVGNAYTPDLAEYITEAWGEQYEDPDAIDLQLTKEAAEAVANAQRLVQECAPVCWTPREREVFALPAVAEAPSSSGGKA